MIDADEPRQLGLQLRDLWAHDIVAAAKDGENRLLHLGVEARILCLEVDEREHLAGATRCRRKPD